MTADLRRSKAFTFVEVLIALAIASIALLALLRLQLISMKMADKAQATAQAVFLAQEKIAEALVSGYPRQETDSGTVERDGLHFTWRTDVVNAGSPQLQTLGLAALRELSVNVTWQDGSSPKNVQMTTYVANNRIHD